MPYIKNERKVFLDFEGSPQTPGELNYVFTRSILKYLNIRGKSYQTVNDIIGALEGAKLEFYRRIVAPYEDIKIQTNGDVYD